MFFERACILKIFQVIFLEFNPSIFSLSSFQLNYNEWP